MLFSLAFLAFSHGQPNEGIEAVYFRSARKYNGTVESLPFDPMIAEISFHAFPNLRADILHARSVPVAFGDGNETEKDHFFRNFDDLNFGYSSFLEINPPSLTHVTLKSYALNQFTLFLANRGSNSDIRISRIYSDSADIFMQNIENTTLRPGDSVSFSFTISVPKIGQFTNIIFMQTSMGTIPYYISYCVKPYPLMQAYSCHVYQTKENLHQFHIETKGTINQSMVFDSTLFDVDTTSISVFTLNLSPRNLSYGTYLTFVYYYTEAGTMLVPIYLHVTNDDVQASKNDVFLQPIYYGESSRTGISLFNPSKYRVNITSVKFELISDDSFSITKLNDFIAPESDTIVASVQVNFAFNCSHASRTAEIECADINGNKHIIKVTVHAGFKQRNAELKTHIDNEKSISGVVCYTVKNNFNDPLVLLGALLNSTILKIHEFTPSILKPGAESRPFFITLGIDLGLLFDDISLTVITNASSFSSEISRFTNSVSIQPTQSLNCSFNQTSGAFSLGSIYTTSKKNISFTLNNTNPSPFYLYMVTSSPGIRVEFSNPFLVGSFHPKKSSDVCVVVEFLAEKGNNIIDYIEFVGEQGSLKILIQWTPIRGSFNVASTIKHHQTFGTVMEGEIHLISNFSYPVEIRCINFNIPIQSEFTEPRNLTNGIENIIANISTTLDDSYELIKGFFEIIDANTSFTAQNDAWENLWSEGLNSKVTFTLMLKNEFYYIHSIPINIGYSNLPRTSIEFSTIHTDEIFIRSTTLTNYFSVPVVFNFGEPLSKSGEYSVKYKKLELIAPRCSYNLVVAIEGYVPGNYNFEIPVTTNSTPPFVLPVSVQISQPKVRFTDNKTMISSLSFIGGEDVIYMSEKWTQCIYFTSFNKEDLSIKNMHITSNNFISYRTNSTLLQQNQTSLLCFDFSLWLYEKEMKSTDIQFTINVKNLVYILPINIQISDIALLHIASSIGKTMELVSFVGVTVPAIGWAVGIVCFVWFKCELLWKSKRIHRAVKHFSVNKLANIECQKSQEDTKPLIQWVYQSRSRVIAPASNQSIDLMEQIFN